MLTYMLYCECIVGVLWSHALLSHVLLSDVLLISSPACEATCDIHAIDMRYSVAKCIVR